MRKESLAILFPPAGGRLVVRAVEKANRHLEYRKKYVIGFITVVLLLNYWLYHGNIDKRQRSEAATFKKFIISDLATSATQEEAHCINNNSLGKPTCIQQRVIEWNVGVRAPGECGEHARDPGRKP